MHKSLQFHCEDLGELAVIYLIADMYLYVLMLMSICAGDN